MGAITVRRKKGAGYMLLVDEHPLCKVAEDAESQAALFVLIEQRTGIKPETAKALLDDGKLISGSDVVVAPILA